MKNIGIQKGLTTIKDYLNNHGYMASEIDTSQKSDTNLLKDLDAIVLTGMDTNFLGMQDTASKIPIIDASGLSPQDVVSSIERQFK